MFPPRGFPWVGKGTFVSRFGRAPRPAIRAPRLVCCRPPMPAAFRGWKRRPPYPTHVKACRALLPGPGAAPLVVERGRAGPADTGEDALRPGIPRRVTGGNTPGPWGNHRKVPPLVLWSLSDRRKGRPRGLSAPAGSNSRFDVSGVRTLADPRPNRGEDVPSPTPAEPRVDNAGSAPTRMRVVLSAGGPAARCAPRQGLFCFPVW